MLKKQRREDFTRRIYFEAVVIGLGVGAAALSLDHLVGEADWLVRVASLLIVGALLCLVQYGLKRTR
jgi:putative flippase GtrA